MKKINFLIFCFSLFQFTAVFAQNESLLEKAEHLLDGKSFMYQYQSGAAIDAAFSEGKLTYQWIAGRNAGKPAKTYPYTSRKLNAGVYYVNWHEADLKNFITLVFNFNTNTCASSVIVNYGSEKPTIAFEGGIIEQVKQN